MKIKHRAVNLLYSVLHSPRRKKKTFRKQTSARAGVSSIDTKGLRIYRARLFLHVHRQRKHKTVCFGASPIRFEKRYMAVVRAR